MLLKNCRLLLTKSNGCKLNWNRLKNKNYHSRYKEELRQVIHPCARTARTLFKRFPSIFQIASEGRLTQLFTSWNVILGEKLATFSLESPCQHPHRAAAACAGAQSTRARLCPQDTPLPRVEVGSQVPERMRSPGRRTRAPSCSVPGPLWRAKRHCRLGCALLRNAQMGTVSDAEVPLN